MDTYVARLSICIRGVVLVLAVLLASNTSKAEIIYTFSGVVPSDYPPEAYTHPNIGPGETWVATLSVNENTPGSQFFGFVVYYAAVKSGSLVFSGGYVSPVDFDGFNITIVDGDPDGDPVDMIRVASPDAGEVVNFIASSMLNPFNDVKSPFTPVRLPGLGTTIVPAPNTDGTGLTHLAYSDSLGSFRYFGLTGTNVSFSVTVPEPASFALASLLGASLLLVRRRS